MEFLTFRSACIGLSETYYKYEDADVEGFIEEKVIPTLESMKEDKNSVKKKSLC